MTEREARLARARAQAVAGHVRVATPSAVVRRVFAVQAQDAVAARLGIVTRGDGVTDAEVRRAYDVERSIVRGWFLRGTLHTVSADDAGWLLRLLGPRAVADSGARYAQLGLSQTVLDRGTLILVAAVADRPRTRAELAERLAEYGGPTDRQAVFHLIRYAALTGRLRLGAERDGEATYEPADTRPAGGDGPSGERAAVELARRYLVAFDEGTAEDFASWSGMAVPQARHAYRQAHGARPPDAAVDDDDAGEPDVRLLPAFDNYLVGRYGRALAVPAAHHRQVWPGGGVIRPTVVVDGLCVATWRRGRGERVEVVHFDSA
jgi:hypothetical protein